MRSPENEMGGGGDISPAPAVRSGYPKTDRSGSVIVCLPWACATDQTRRVFSSLTCRKKLVCRYFGGQNPMMRQDEAVNARRRGTNLPKMGDFNQSVILEAIRRSGDGLSRTELVSATGLSAQTVT